jgi:precorrin-6A synthase
MLTGTLGFGPLADWRIWWGGNLGGADERLISGRVGEVEPAISRAREELKSAAGWVMDVYLLRRP